jgi:hypothetical protein
MAWQRAVWAGAVVGAPIIAGAAGGREWGGASRAAAAPAAGEVAGVVTLAGGGRLEDAVVYLEPLDPPRAAAAAAAPRAPAARPTAAPAAPADSVRLLWGAVRELGLVARDLRDRVSALRAGDARRADAAAPRTPTLAALDSAARGDAPRPSPGPSRRAPSPPRPSGRAPSRCAPTS